MARLNHFDEVEREADRARSRPIFPQSTEIPADDLAGKPGLAREWRGVLRQFPELGGDDGHPVCLMITPMAVRSLMSIAYHAGSIDCAQSVKTQLDEIAK